MRAWVGAAAVLLPLALGMPALSADLGGPPASNPVPAWPPSFYDPSRFEVRGGFLPVMPNATKASSSGPEFGTVDVNGEVVFPKFFGAQGIWDYFIPRLQLGGMMNLSGKTDYAYAGPVWTQNWTNRIFTELAFGGAIHDGYLTGVHPGHALLGCRVLYHEGASVGYRIDQHWDVMVTFDHISNGKPTFSNCSVNEGMTVLGLRIGYQF